VAVGLTDGFALVDVKPAGLLTHEYVCQLLMPRQYVLPPLQMLVFEPAFADGSGVNGNNYGVDLLQPVAVTVSVSV